MAKPNVVLVGAGSMGRNHARIISGHPDANLLAVVDPFEENGKTVAAAHETKWVKELDDVLASADAVVLAAATEQHQVLAEQVIAAGLPFLIEKPVCPGLAETEAVLALAESRGVPVQCGFLERFNAGVVAARSLIEQPVYVRAIRHSPYWARIKTGVSWDMLVHDADLITMLFDSQIPVRVSAAAAYVHPQSLPGAEDVLDMTLQFAGGAIASASASRMSQRKVRKLLVQSIDSMVEIDLLLRSVTKYRHANIESTLAHVGFKQLTEMEVPEVSGPEPLLAQFEHFLGLVAGRVDAQKELRSILPAHRIIQEALTQVG